jgi:predicted DNA-binding transcriptional regulator YafY
LDARKSVVLSRASSRKILLIDMSAKRPKTNANERSTRLRLRTLQDELLNARTPLRIVDLAKKHGVSRHTIVRNLAQLETGDPPLPLVWDRGGIQVVDRDRILIPFQMNLHQAMKVYLASRLLARFSPRPDEDTIQALHQLGHALRRYAPRIAEHIGQTSEQLRKQMPLNADDGEARNLRAITRAWARGERVKLRQRSKPDELRLFEPYFVEVNPVGYLSYVIGFDVDKKAERTFTIERLQEVIETTESYSIPATFNPYPLLANAWGVNWGDGRQLVQVHLRFSAGKVAQRVQETRWHPSQRIETRPDGRLDFHVEVGDIKDMLWWVRQWGSACEVLAPAHLRLQIAEDVQRASAMYGTGEVL